jgi:hypothetical protein
MDGREQLAVGARWKVIQCIRLTSSPSSEVVLISLPEHHQSPLTVQQSV